MRSSCGRNAAPTPSVELRDRCWRVDMAVHLPVGPLDERQISQALGRGVRLDADGARCRACFSVSADDMALAARVALGRWTQLGQELGLGCSDVVELHISQVEASRVDPTPLTAAHAVSG